MAFNKYFYKPKREVWGREIEYIMGKEQFDAIANTRGNKNINPYIYVIEYINELTLYNTNCHKMLDLAIQYKNRRLAEMIVASVKPSYRYWNYISSSSCITIYDFSSNSAIDEAKKKLEEAIAAGLI